MVEDRGENPAPTKWGRLQVQNSAGAKFGEAIGGGAERGFHFAKREAHDFVAVSGFVEEAGAGNDGDADFFDEIFCERHVVGIAERGNICHHVVSATRNETAEARL